MYSMSTHSIEKVKQTSIRVCDNIKSNNNIIIVICDYMVVHEFCYFIRDIKMHMVIIILLHGYIGAIDNKPFHTFHADIYSQSQSQSIGKKIATIIIIIDGTNVSFGWPIRWLMMKHIYV